MSLKYYLDTSAIYHIRKLPDHVLEQSFYSSFTLIELIAGLNVQQFGRRKALLHLLFNSVASIDETFPEQLIIRAFNSFDEYEIQEKRMEDLYSVIDKVLKSQTFDEFERFENDSKQEFNFQYFLHLDKTLTDTFYGPAVKGRNMIQSALAQNSKTAKIKLAGTTYDLSTREAIVEFLNSPMVNDSFTILALANAGIGIMGWSRTEMKEQKVYSSYNGSLSVFVEGMNTYSLDQFKLNKLPRRNDFQDLLHLLYLRNRNDLKIISEDKLFRLCIPDSCLTITELTN